MPSAFFKVLWRSSHVCLQSWQPLLNLVSLGSPLLVIWESLDNFVVSLSWVKSRPLVGFVMPFHQISLWPLLPHVLAGSPSRSLPPCMCLTLLGLFSRKQSWWMLEGPLLPLGVFAASLVLRVCPVGLLVLLPSLPSRQELGCRTLCSDEPLLYQYWPPC